MAAVQPPSRARQEQPQEPKLAFFPPVILPWDYELQFWTSPLLVSAANDIDTVNLFVRICENCLFMFRSLRGIPDNAVSLIRQQFQRMFIFSALHVVLKVVSPELYARCRIVTVLHLRLYSLLSSLSVFQLVRYVIAAGTHAHLIRNVMMYQAVRGGPAFVTARALIVFCGCAGCAIHALPPVLPFIAQLIIQLVYLYYCFKYVAPLTTDLFSSPDNKAGTQQLCDALSRAIPTPHTFLPRVPASSPAARVCGIQRAWLLVLFFQLFVGFLLPLYLCYTYERRLKLRFLRQLRDEAPPATRKQHPAPPPSAQQQQELAPHTPLSPRAHNASATPQLPDSTQKGMLVSALKALAPQRTPTGDRPSAPSTTGHLLLLLRSCLLHAAALSLLAALSWQLVVALHVPLVRHIKVLSFLGGHRQWYWELLCGDDQPCCPA